MAAEPNRQCPCGKAHMVSYLRRFAARTPAAGIGQKRAKRPRASLPGNNGTGIKQLSIVGVPKLKNPKLVAMSPIMLIGDAMSFPPTPIEVYRKRLKVVAQKHSIL